MKVNAVHVGVVTVVAPEGRLDAAGAEDLQRVIDQEMQRESHWFVLDLTNTEYVSSVGMRVLLRLEKALMATGGHARVVKPKDHVFEIFQLSNLDQVLDFRYSLTEALKDFPVPAQK